jgi:hypothetical protein
MAKRRDYFVTVCDRCLKASCWHGIFMCESSRDAGTREILASELRKMRTDTHEHPSYFAVAGLMRICGSVRWAQ